MGDRSRWISESKASLDSIVSCRIARATQRNSASKDGERREREGERESERETDRDRERQSHRKPSEH